MMSLCTIHSTDYMGKQNDIGVQCANVKPIPNGSIYDCTFMAHELSYHVTVTDAASTRFFSAVVLFHTWFIHRFNFSFMVRFGRMSPATPQMLVTGSPKLNHAL